MTKAKEPDICMKCKDAIKAENDGIECSGVCNRAIHLTCAFLGDSEAQIIAENDNIHYICDECEENCLKKINNKINGLYEYLYKLDERTASILKILNERNDSTQSDIIEVDTPKRTPTKQTKFNKNTKTDDKVMETKESKKKKEQNEPKKQPQNTRAKSPIKPIRQNTSQSNSNKRAHEPKPPNKATNKSDKSANEKSKPKANENNKTNGKNGKFAVVIKPKKQQSTNQTIMDLNQKCDTSKLNLNNVIKTKFGTVIIECGTNEQQNAIKKRIEEKLSNKYDISEKSPLSPKIKIFGITESMELKVLEDLLKRQNEVLQYGLVKALKITSDFKEKDVFNAIVEVDKYTFDKVMEKKKVLINWDSCHVKEHYSIMRCHNCVGFNHAKEECRNDLACGYCAKEHLSSECDEVEIACINCITANDKYKLNLDVNHNAWSRKCQILKKKIIAAGERTEYTSNK